MSQDTTDSEAVEKCGATTASGTPCQNPAGSCPHHGEDNSNDTRESPTETPSRESFEELGGFIIDETGFNGKDDDSVATQAGKAWVKYQGGGKDLYRSLFGECPEPDCSYGANGFEAEYCRRHLGDDDDDTTESDTDSVSIEDLSGEEAKQLLTELVNQ